MCRKKAHSEVETEEQFEFDLNGSPPWKSSLSGKLEAGRH